MFWELTLHELDVLIARRREVVAREADYPAKLICWYLVNIWRNTSEHPDPLPFEEVFPDAEPREETEKERTARLLAKFRAMTASLGGQDLTGLD